MRFGKRLSEMQTHRGHGGQHYISYKELKHTLGEISQLLGSMGCGKVTGGADSSGDEGSEAIVDGSQVARRSRQHASSSSLEEALAISGDPSASSSSSKPATPSKHSGVEDLFVKQQRRFFDCIDTDVAKANSHMQSVLAALEASVGEWQSQAAMCGLLFTPLQLEEVASNVPFHLKDEEAFVDWLISLQPVDRTRSARQALAARYCEIADILHTLLQYIEVNVTAVRKILKKFEKKVPAEFRVQNAQSYKAHHELLSLDLQHLIVAMVQMCRLTHDAKALDPVLKVEGVLASPISFVGVETLQLLQKIRGPQELHDLLSGQPAARSIDVFAKPSTEMESGNAIVAAASKGVSIMTQQAAANIGNTDLFQGPPKPHGKNHNAETGKSVSVTSQINPLSRPPQGNAAGNGRGNTNQSGRGGGKGSGSDQMGKGGNKRGRGNRGQRGAGHPLQGSNSSGRASNETQGADCSSLSSMLGMAAGMEQSYAANDTKSMAAYQGKGGQHTMNQMSCMMPGMYMMVPTAWQGGPPGSWKGGGVPQMGGVPPHLQTMATWQNGTMPQQWPFGVMPDKGMSPSKR
jgi:hypothetical protein